MAANKALAEIASFVAAEQWAAPDLAKHVGISETSAWRVLTTDPPTWTPCFRKVHKFIKSRAGATEVQSPTIGEAIDSVVAGRRRATASLFRALADMLERA